MYRAAEKPKYVTSDDLVLSDAERGINDKVLACFLCFIITALVKLP